MSSNRSMIAIAPRSRHQPKTQNPKPPNWVARLRASGFHVRHIRLEVDREAVNVAGTHDQRMIADEVLEIMNLPIVRAVRRIRAYHFGLTPVRLEIILRHAAAMALRPERERSRDVILRMRRGDREAVPELVERDLLADRVRELTTDFVTRERPLHLHAAESF